VHKNLKKLTIHCEYIDGVELKKSMFMDTLTIGFAGTELKIRCYGANKFKKQILSVCDT
jgi:hypothetical protein